MNIVSSEEKRSRFIVAAVTLVAGRAIAGAIYAGTAIVASGILTLISAAGKNDAKHSGEKNQSPE